MADIETFSVLTAGLVPAGVALTHVDSLLTVLPVELVSTATDVVIDAVNASSSVHTGGGRAVLVILLTVPA